ncbi:DNA/RNA helicase domain-containing protein [Weissella confusa]|uniref:DNA/RNA helicase domain-containing protein n=1 Tax=Weissella confusa TaxID=1583 RepID=UPI000AFD1A17|nr:DNA/RNA helicase domain-containing protein [Weissella confusa]
MLSTLFYELSSKSFAKAAGLGDSLDSYLLVNHDQQVTVYEQVAKKLGIGQGRENVVNKPTKWLNVLEDSDPLADVVLIDEAHLLWTQGKQAYRGKNQLDDILKKAKLVIDIFDERQILRSEQHLTHTQVNKLMGRANEIIELKHQFRIDANDETVDWIESFVQGEIKPIPEDDSYELKIFENVSDMYEEIKSKNKDSKKRLGSNVGDV